MKTINVAAVALVNNKKVLLTQRNDSRFKGLWEFPGGKIENNETIYQTAKRELKEELLIDIKPIKHFFTAEFDYPDFHLRMHMIYCQLEAGKITLTEHSAYKWVSVEKLDLIDWVPADVSVVKPLKELINSL